MTSGRSKKNRGSMCTGLHADPRPCLVCFRCSQEALKHAKSDLKAMIEKLNQSGQEQPSAMGDESDPQPTDREHLVRALRDLESQKKFQRKRKIANARVIGLTVAACDFDLLSGTEGAALRCPIVFLDEASQMTEPASIIPIARFKAERLLAVGGTSRDATRRGVGAVWNVARASWSGGLTLHWLLFVADPHQLGPTIVGLDSDDLPEDERWYQRTLFVRLQQAGIPMTALRAQYRMHPKLSQVPNQLFYEVSTAPHAVPT